MDPALIAANREKVRSFLGGAEKSMSFEVTAPLEERIGFIYRVLFPGLSRFAFYGRFILARTAQYLDYPPLKVFFYRRAGIRIGKGVYLSPDVVLDVHFPELIVIEDYAILGWGARLFAHEFKNGSYRLGRIRIGRGALIGAFAVVRGGVDVGDGAEVPYNATVFRDVPAGSSLPPRDSAKSKGGRG